MMSLNGQLSSCTNDNSDICYYLSKLKNSLRKKFFPKLLGPHSILNIINVHILIPIRALYCYFSNNEQELRVIMTEEICSQLSQLRFSTGENF